MTRHRDEAANLHTDRRRIRALAVGVCLLVVSSLGMIVAPSPSVPQANALPEPEVSEPTARPSYGPIAPIFPTDLNPPEITHAIPLPSPSSAAPSSRTPAGRTGERAVPTPGRASAAEVEAPGGEPVGTPSVGAGEPSEPVPAGEPDTSVTAGLLDLINEARAAADPACGAVTASAELDAFALAHAVVQATERRMRHSDPIVYAENVAAGYPDAASVVAGWLASTEGHRENIENCRWTRMGIGAARDQDGRLYWTQVFA